MRSTSLAVLAVAALMTTASPALAQSSPWTPVRPVLAAAEASAEGVLVLPLGSIEDLQSRGAALDAASRTGVERAIASARFNFSAGRLLVLRGFGGWDQIVIVGLPADADESVLQRVGATVGRSLADESGPVSFVVEGLTPDALGALATGYGYGDYAFTRHISRSGDRTARQGVTFVGAGDWTVQARRAAALTQGLVLARDLSNEPANIVYPEVFVERARAAFQGVAGTSIEVLTPAEMERLGMGALLGVARGSERPARMLIVRYRGAGSADQPIVLVGKGVTFDSGGLSIKPSTGMGNMRMDMSGAASVTGAVLALARQGAPVHVVAVAPLVENMPDGAAIRPGDILTAMNGRTIEIGSTDAEGRLILADAIAYAEARLDPALIVDVATLTGAVGGALGNEYAGLFANDETLAAGITAAAAAVGEPVWRLPMHPSYTLRSSFADLSNSGSGPGASTGAWFISNFVEPGTPWAHLDIAGVAWGGPGATHAPGSNGYAVRMLERFVHDRAAAQ